jgi:hypothetical protein
MKLLLKILKIIVLPDDIIDLIATWLNNRPFYVSLDGENSYIDNIFLGMVHGSILGPILYTSFVATLFY